MRILLVAATAPEVAPVAAALALPQGPHAEARTVDWRGHTVAGLITGVGMVATAVWCTRALAAGEYDLAMNLGVCGAFDPALAPGTAVHVVADGLAELGAEDGDQFLTLQQMQLLGDNAFPYRDGWLRNDTPPVNPALDALPQVRGITVNTVHGADASIAAVRRRFDPQVETMEGAAFMYACLVAGVPFAQVRAVSNLVERRNRAAWKLPEAVAALGRTTLGILEAL